MITHIVTTIKQRESRRFFAAYLTGKMIGVAAVIAVMFGSVWFFGTQAGALGMHTQAVKAAEIQREERERQPA